MLARRVDDAVALRDFALRAATALGVGAEADIGGYIRVLRCFSPMGRPAALAALEAVRAGKAGGLLVAKMDRLSRSVVDGAGLMERAAREGWALHFADLDIDTGTPAGEMAANIIISGSQYERRLISQRTRDALAAKRARGERLAQRRPYRWRSPVGSSAERRRAEHSRRSLTADGRRNPHRPWQDPLVSGYNQGDS